jgi:pimeloyl-ACP methyl ester carboxylesterase
MMVNGAVMHVIKDIAPGNNRPHTLLVALPGAGDCAQDLIDQQFVQALRERQLPVDFFAVDVPMDDYLDGNVVRQLAEQVITPAREAGWSRIWLMGISLGGMAALSYVSQRPRDIAGAMLIAPFLGTRGLLAEVGRAGGLDAWQPGVVAERDDERRLMAWLKHTPAHESTIPPLLLGYGHEDRFAAASRLLSQRLPASRVLTFQGGHDWPTWHALWRCLLDHPLSEYAP